MVYIDDITVYSPSLEQHQRDLEDVFRQLEAALHRVSVSKTRIAQDAILVLGNCVSASDIKPNLNKVTVILHMPPPQSVFDIKRFMVMIRFYQRLIPGCSTVGKPLFELCRNNV